SGAPRDRGGDRLLGGRGTAIAARGPVEAEKGGAGMNGDFFEDEDSTVRALRSSATARRAQDGGAEEAAAKLAERAAREELLDVAYAKVDSPFGGLLAARKPRGLVRLAFPEENEDEVLERLAKRVSPRIMRTPGRFDGLA